MAVSLFCAEGEQTPRICVSDNDAEPNKIIHFAFLRNGTVLDTSTPEKVAESLLAAELACRAIVIRNVSGMYDGGEAQMGPGQGRQAEKLLGYNHGLDFTDYVAIENIGFYDDLAKNMSRYYFVFFTANYAWPVRTTATLIPKPAVTDDNSTQIQIGVRVTWRDPKHPLPYRADTFPLDCCQSLFDVEDAEFLNVSGSTAAIFGLEVDVTQTGGVGSPIAVELNTPVGVKIDSATVTSEVKLPTGLVLALKPNGAGIRISGTPTEAGRKEVTIRLQNACGVAATLETVFAI